MRVLITIAITTAVAASSCNLIGTCRKDSDCASPFWCDTSAGTCVGYARPDSGTPALEVTITSPSTTVFTNSSVLFLVTVKGASATKVELLSNDALLIDMEGPPYAYTWETSGSSGHAAVTEGTHSITARATVGGTQVTSAPVTVMVDRTSPTAVRLPSSPAAENLGLRDTFQVAFSEPMRATVADAVGLAADCGTVVFSRSLSADGKSASFHAQSEMRSPCVVTATLGNGVVDLAGNTMAASTLSWTMPLWQRIGEPVSTNAGTYSLAVDPTGAPVIAYEEAPGSPAAHIGVKRWSGSAWELLGSLGSASAITPSLALDALGQPTVAWIEGTASPHLVKVSRRRAGAWEPLLDPTTDAGTMVADPAWPVIALKADGSPCVGFGGLQNAYNAGNCVQSWSPTSHQWDWWGCQAFHYGGRSALEVDQGNRILFAYSWADESGLGTLERADAGWVAFGHQPSSGVEPSLAVSGDAGVIAWRSTVFPGGVKKVFAKTWDGADWAPKVSTSSLTPLNTAEGVLPSAAIDVLFGPVVGWVEPKVGHFVKAFSDGGWVPLGGALNASTPAADLTYGPSLATDLNHDNFAVAWSLGATLYVVRHNR